jgi:hypothetical protein
MLSPHGMIVLLLIFCLAWLKDTAGWEMGNVSQLSGWWSLKTINSQK